MQFNGLKISENEKYKICKSSDYNFVFNKKNGFFARWGKTRDDDPIYAPAPEILDLEISSGNIGTEEQMCKGKCKFCYKKNNSGKKPIHNMTFDEFKTIFHKFPPLLGQIAFGIMNISTNPDFFKMLKYARQNGVIPNYTCHGLDVTPEIAKKTAELCGAIAVSLVNKEKTYDAIKMFSIDNNMTQCNMHYLLSLETYDKAFEIITDISEDPRLKKFNAIVFLQYKHKNKKSTFHSILDPKKYQKLTEYCEEKKVNYGFDSCSAPIYLESIKNKKNKNEISQYCEPCESGIFSSYVNCYGKFFVCSFAENEDKWVEGIDVLNCDNFTKDIWMSEKLVKWRKRLLGNKRNCPIYDLNLIETKV